MSTSQRYIVYLTAASGSEPVGTVINAIEWDGTASVPLPANTATLADPNSQYPIGSVYTASAS